MGVERRPASVPVSGSVSVFGARVAVGVGGSRVRERARVALVPLNGSATRRLYDDSRRA